MIFSIFILAFLTKSNYSLPTLLSLLIKSVYTQNILSREGFILTFMIPRVQFMGLYVANTAMLLFLLFSLSQYINLHKSIKFKILIWSIVMVSILFTGSRITLLCFILLAPFYFLRTTLSIRLFFLFLLCFLTIALYYVDIKELYASFSNIRQGSDNTRTGIYLKSFKLAMKNNFLFGIGIKPRIHEVADGFYPVGSHSTFIGYIVKNGFIGFLFVLLFHFFFLGKYILLMARNIIHTFNQRKTFILTSIILFVVNLWFEDLDAYMMVCFFFGILLGIYNNISLINSLKSYSDKSIYKQAMF